MAIAAPVPAVAAPKPKAGITSGEILGALLFLGGVAAATYYFRFYETAVATPFGSFNNLGLMQERQQGMTISGGVAFVGLVLMITLRKKR